MDSSRHFSVVSRIAGKHSLRLLATVILLSYAKIIKTVIDVIWPSTIFQVTNSNDSSTHYQTVWKMDGTVQYLHGHHRILFVFAVIVGICTLPYTLSLLFIQCLKKVSHYRVLFWVVKLKPLFDAYTGPYKDKFYFWTGFLLVIRITLFIAIASNTTKGPILNLSLVCVTAAILLLLCQAGVYKAWPVSIIESFTYFNLIIFSMGMAYVLQLTSKLTISHHKDRAVILCVGSMFLLFCGIVAYTSQCVSVSRPRIRYSRNYKTK